MYECVCVCVTEREKECVSMCALIVRVRELCGALDRQSLISNNYNYVMHVKRFTAIVGPPPILGGQWFSALYQPLGWRKWGGGGARPPILVHIFQVSGGGQNLKHFEHV